MSPLMNSEQQLTTNEAGRILGLQYYQVTALRQEGILKGTDLGRGKGWRYDRQEVLRLAHVT